MADFRAYCRSMPNRLDPGGAEPRDEHLRARAAIREIRLGNRMLRIVADLDPERAAYSLAAVHARTNLRRTTTDGDDDGSGRDEEGEADDRSNVTDLHARRDRSQPDRAQSKLDAVTTVLRDAGRADEGSQAGVDDTTVLVRIDLPALLTGLGAATIDGIDTPVPAATARGMAAEADLIPQVVEGRWVLLDQGRTRHILTRAQRSARSMTGVRSPAATSRYR